jgi:hypothetical protein
MTIHLSLGEVLKRNFDFHDNVYMYIQFYVRNIKSKYFQF